MSSKSGAYYFPTIVYDFNRMTWVILLQNKAQVYGAIETFLKRVKTQFSTNVKVIGIDNGTESLNSRFNKLFQREGIIKDYAHIPHAKMGWWRENTDNY